jgi:serine/threonine protein kinase/predicted negative regulator of RcsB-dependent stress response
MDAIAWRPGTVVADIYTIIKEIGRGGMGIVHLAREGEVGRLVAIKSPLVTGSEGVRFVEDTGARRSFMREATAWMDLGSHPNIVRAFDVREVEYLPRIFMEYCDAGSLRELLMDHPQGLPWQEVYDVGAQLCWAVAFAHEKGMLHRDLKPANVLLLSDGRAKVTDFGLVHSMGQSDAEARVAADWQISASDKEQPASNIPSGKAWGGTPQYMPPEQWSGDPSPASDMYALGEILFELCTGQRAFDLATHPYCRSMGIDPKKIDPSLLVSLYRKLHCEENPINPASLRNDIPHLLSQLIEKCLAKKPERRPATALEVVQDLMLALQPFNVNVRLRQMPDKVRIEAEEKRDRAWALLRLCGASALMRGDMRDMLQPIQEAQALFGEVRDSVGMSACQLQIAMILQAQGEEDQAAKMYEVALANLSSLQDMMGVSTCLVGLGQILHKRGEYHEAESHFEQALRIREQEGNQNAVANCYVSLANVHYQLGNYHRAREEYESALRIRQKTGDEQGIASCWINLGNVFYQLGQFDQAEVNFCNALPVMQKVGNRMGIADLFVNLAVLYERTGRQRDALVTYETTLQIRREMNAWVPDWLEPKIRELRQRLK